MKLTTNDIEKLRTALAAAKVISSDVAVIGDGKILGANAQKDAAIMSELQLSIPIEAKIGIGRLQELDKRLALFGESLEAELKQNDRGDVISITLMSGRSKMQFRCTSLNMLEKKYPKQNEDTPVVIVTLLKNEISQVSRAAKTLGAETIVIKVASSGAVHIECVDSNNDQFVINPEKQAEFVDEADTVVFVYSADRLTSLLDAGSKDYDEMALVIGEYGSLTGIIKGHSLIIMPQATGE